MKAMSCPPARKRGESAMSDIKWRGEELKRRLAVAAEEIVWLAAQDAIAKATNNVPLDTGTLRRSGVVTIGKAPNPQEVYEEAYTGTKGSEYSNAHRPSKPPHGSDVVAVASYNTPYALKLHEDTTWSPRSVSSKGRAKPAVGGPKWLEKSTIIVTKRFAVYVARARKKAGL